MRFLFTLILVSFGVARAQGFTKEINYKTTVTYDYLSTLVDTFKAHQIYRVEQVFLDNDKQFGFFGSYGGHFTNGNPYTSDVIMIYDKLNGSYKKKFARYGDGNSPKTYNTIAYNEKTTEMVMGGIKTMKFFNKDSAKFFYFEVGASGETNFTSSACLSNDLFALAGYRSWNDSVAMNVFFYHRDVLKIKSKNMHVAKYGSSPDILRISDTEVLLSYSYQNDGEGAKHVIEKISFDNSTRTIKSIWRKEYPHQTDNKLELGSSDQYFNYAEGINRLVQFNNYYIRTFGVRSSYSSLVNNPGFIMYDLSGKKITEILLPSSSHDISSMEILPINSNLFAIITIDNSDISTSGTDNTNFTIDLVDGAGKYIKTIVTLIPLEIFNYAMINEKQFSVMGIYDYSTKYQKAIFTILNETY